MDTRLLKMFCAVAETGSLATAAGKLHLTPSAISHGIKSLETEVGCRLFERAGKRVLINQAGEQLLAQVKPPLAALDAAAESLRRLGKWGQTRLRIGAAASACQYLLPGVIRELKKTHARLELQIESGDTPELVKWVRANQLDLALCIAPDQGGGLEAHPAFRDELMFVFAPDHPWAAGKPMSKDELRSQPLILYQRNSYTARLIDDFFRDQNIVPSTTMEIGSIAAIKEMVTLGLGVAALAPWTCERELALGVLRARPLGGKPVRREWAIVSLEGRPMTMAEVDFCKLCRGRAAGMRLDRKDATSLNRPAKRSSQKPAPPS